MWGNINQYIVYHQYKYCLVKCRIRKCGKGTKYQLNYSSY